jgi:HTH-type transcriptional regulator, glycine betaine synthesis regulator
MDETLENARQHFIQGLSGISQFWGYPKAMGAIYAVLYLSPEPLSLDEIAAQSGISKGAASTNLRALDRLKMVHKQVRIGERKDFYIAEIDFWKMIRAILQERQKSEFDHAIRTVGESLEMIQPAEIEPSIAGRADFYHQRLQAMQSFFHTLDNLVATILALDELRSGAIQRLVGGLKDNSDE